MRPMPEVDENITPTDRRTATATEIGMIGQLAGQVFNSWGFYFYFYLTVTRKITVNSVQSFFMLPLMPPAAKGPTFSCSFGQARTIHTYVPISRTNHGAGYVSPSALAKGACFRRKTGQSSGRAERPPVISASNLSGLSGVGSSRVQTKRYNTASEHPASQGHWRTALRARTHKQYATEYYRHQCFANSRRGTELEM